MAAAVALAMWNLLVQASAGRRRCNLGLEVALRPQHYVQACAHLAIFAYWGWYWPEVYRAAHLIAAQLVFAYAFDMILAWSRREVYTIGFGPLPIIFSTNLFLWFKPDWFYLQFLMLAVGFAGKALIRWERDGRRTHIFNPSSFSLGLFSVALIAAGATDTTWGQEIAVTQFYPPQMYLFLFAVALPGQYLFGVTTMTASAVVTMYLFGLAYHAATGVYFFFDSYIPIAVFLGMHLLVTDPSTSPRTDLGADHLRVSLRSCRDRLVLRLSACRCAAVLRQAVAGSGAEPVCSRPRSGGRVQTSAAARPVDDCAYPARTASSSRLHRVWAVVFTLMSAAQGVGDTHRGQWLPFWLEACQRNRTGACAYLAGLETIACRLGSGWSCNELGILEAERRGGPPTCGFCVRPSLPSWLQRGLPKRHVRIVRNNLVARPADAERISDHSQGEQGTPSGPYSSRTHDPCVQTGMARHMRRRGGSLARLLATGLPLVFRLRPVRLARSRQNCAYSTHRAGVQRGRVPKCLNRARTPARAGTIRRSGSGCIPHTARLEEELLGCANCAASSGIWCSAGWPP